MVILPQVHMTLAYFGYAVGPFGLLALKDFIWVSNLLIINVFDESYPKTRSVH